MNHSFNTDLAKKYGVDGAIIIENMFFWIQKNKANDKHFYDGKYWTYNSIKAFEEMFPYWTSKQIRRILTNLEKEGAIETGVYNKSSYDRTKWYTLTEEVYSILLNENFHLTKWANENDQKGEPIPYINTNINKNSNNSKVIMDKWNSIGLSKIIKIENQRLKHLNARIEEYSLDIILEAIDKVSNSDFLKGFNNKNWKADIDWLLNPNNFIKVIEGKYDNKVNKPKKQVRRTETNWDE